jgi:hypothetical protein
MYLRYSGLTNYARKKGPYAKQRTDLKSQLPESTTWLFHAFSQENKLPPHRENGKDINQEVSPWFNIQRTKDLN